MTRDEAPDELWKEHRGTDWRDTRHRKHCLDAGYRAGYAAGRRDGIEEILNKPCGCVEHQAAHLAEKYRKALEAIAAGHVYGPCEGAASGMPLCCDWQADVAKETLK